VRGTNQRASHGNSNHGLHNLVPGAPSGNSLYGRANPENQNCIEVVTAGFVRRTRSLSGVAFLCMRFAVLMHGILRGMGHQAACELLATKSVTPETARPVYSHCAVIEAPIDLPDGDYEIEFGDNVAITRKQNGAWVVGAVLPNTYQEAARFYAARERSRKGASTRRSSDPDDLQRVTQ
jgi:hypothetical protein